MHNFEEQHSDKWKLAKETFLKLGVIVNWKSIEEDAIYSCDPYVYGTMLWWLYERKQEGMRFIDIYLQISYVMGVKDVAQRIARFKDCQLPFPGFKPGHLNNLFDDFLLDLKRTLQVLDPSCKEAYFHTAI